MDDSIDIKNLGLDTTNLLYFTSLLEKHRSQKTASEPPKLAPVENAKRIAYPLGSGELPPEIEAQNPAIDYDELVKSFDGSYARRARLMIRKLQAGTGTTISRAAPNPKAQLGAKGTDLLVEIADPRDSSKTVKITLVELLLLRAFKISQTKEFAGLILQDIVGPETKSRLEEIWSKPSLIDPSKTYDEVFASTPGLARFRGVFQSHVPTINSEGELSLNRKAPAGHGLFGVDAILDAVHPNERLPKADDTTLIGVIANGEDLNSMPDAAIIDWMIKTEKPIVLVTTTKTPSDTKGGILCLVVDSQSGETFLKVLETAEAKANGQLAQFEATPGFASTNLTLFHFSLLNKKLKGIPEDELLRVMSPDLIPNWKEQVDKDGVTRKYLQLEGTVGSVIMNLDRYYRKTKGEALVAVVNVPTDKRVSFFSPIKSAFDYIMQFHSDRFRVNADYKLEQIGRTPPLKLQLLDPATSNKFYQDVQSAQRSLGEASLKDLRELNVTGQVLFGTAILRGEIDLVNETAEPKSVESLDLPVENGRRVLQNIRVHWPRDGAPATIEPRTKNTGVAHARVSTSGSHTDYNGGLTLASLLPVKTSTTVYPRLDSTVHVTSADVDFSYTLGQEAAQNLWGDYIQGATAILRQDGFKIRGFDAEITSNIPQGAGISSSAALVTSLFKALRGAFDLKLSDFEIAKLGQRVEHFVGARTGLLDQMTISLLNDDTQSALFIDFSDMSYQKVAVPENAEFAILHSGLTHSLKDTHGTRNYATRRNETETVATQLGVKSLSDLTLAQLEGKKAELDPVLYARARHVVTENDRVRRFSKASEKHDLREMGKIMSESHVSQRDHYDISEDPINVLVDVLEKTPGVYGAQLTGGGFGGAVVFLTEKGQAKAIAAQAIAKYAELTGGRYQAHLIAPLDL